MPVTWEAIVASSMPGVLAGFLVSAALAGAGTIQRAQHTMNRGTRRFMMPPKHSGPAPPLGPGRTYLTNV